MDLFLYDDSLRHESVKAIMVMPSLLLQKPSQKLKSKDHLSEDWNEDWNYGSQGKSGNCKRKEEYEGDQ